MTIGMRVAAIVASVALCNPMIAAQDWVQMCQTGYALDSTGTHYDVYDVVLQGDTAFATWIDNSYDNRLSSIDLSGSAPTIICTLPLPGQHLRNLAIHAGIAFVAAGANGMYPVDISDPDSMYLRGTFDLTGIYENIAIGGENGHYAYIAAGSGGLQIANVADPDTTYEVETLNLTAGGESTDVRAVRTYGTTVYVGGGADISGTTRATFHVVDVFDTSAAEAVAEWHTDSTSQHTRDLAIKGTYVYLAVDDNHIYVLNNSFYEDTIADTSCYPCYLETVSTEASVIGLDVQGEYLYAAAQANGVEVFYLGDPASPRSVGSYDPPNGLSQRVDVQDERIAMNWQANSSTDTPRVIFLCQQFARGDVDTSGAIENSDVTYLTNYVFYGGAEPEPEEWNGDVKDALGNCARENPTVNLSDVILLNNFVNNGGDPPDCFVVPCTCGS